MINLLSFLTQLILNLKQKNRDLNDVFEFHSDFIFRAQTLGKGSNINIQHNDER